MSDLLDSAETEAEFKADVDRLVTARRQNLHLASYRQFPNWLGQTQKQTDQGEE